MSPIDSVIKAIPICINDAEVEKQELMINQMESREAMYEHRVYVTPAQLKATDQQDQLPIISAHDVC